ncbi:MAG: DUF1289 domain-containing protein [Bacteroidetes bacterium]|nr:MAG: DUF1289 domain-containing protein [Bacteroidota bacterium]
MSDSSQVKSPCTHVCTHDTNDICLGCYRSLEEIRKWYHCTDNGKREIIKNAEKRRAEKDRDNLYERYV